MFSSGEKIKGIAETANIHWGGFDFYNKKHIKGTEKQFTMGRIDCFTYL
jgi:hypothetical protein